MTRTVDQSLESDLDKVSSICIDMSLRIREEDPRRLFDEFAYLCEWHPRKAAQLLQCFSALVDPDTSQSELEARVWAITEARSLRRVS